LLCIEISAALRHFRVDILIQICVKRNERVIALDPDPRGVQCRPIPAISGLDPFLPVARVRFRDRRSIGRLGHVLLKRLPMREITQTTINWILRTAAISAIAESIPRLAFTRMLYAMKKANAATANGKPRFIRAGLRSVEMLSQCWHLYSTVILGHPLEKIVRELGANVAESQCGHRNQDKRARLNGEAASIKIACRVFHSHF
jgi:hypothetical protein